MQSPSGNSDYYVMLVTIVHCIYTRTLCHIVAKYFMNNSIIKLDNQIKSQILVLGGGGGGGGIAPGKFLLENRAMQFALMPVLNG